MEKSPVQLPSTHMYVCALVFLSVRVRELCYQPAYERRKYSRSSIFWRGAGRPGAACCWCWRRSRRVDTHRGRDSIASSWAPASIPETEKMRHGDKMYIAQIEPGSLARVRRAEFCLWGTVWWTQKSGCFGFCFFIQAKPFRTARERNALCNRLSSSCATLF